MIWRAHGKFLYDGADLVAEYSDSGALLRRYVHGGGMDEPLVWYEGSGTTDRRYFHADERGSIVALSNDSGAGTVSFKYSPDGEANNAGSSRFAYTGQVWLAQPGLSYYKSRMYSPKLARFLQTDAIGYAGGMNLYAYVGGDPINRIDPFGFDHREYVLIDGITMYGPRMPWEITISEFDYRDIWALDAYEASRDAVESEGDPGGGGEDGGGVGGSGEAAEAIDVPLNYAIGTTVGGAAVGAVVGANHARAALIALRTGHLLLIAAGAADVAALAAVGAAAGGAAGVALGLAFAGGYAVGTIVYTTFTDYYYGP